MTIAELIEDVKNDIAVVIDGKTFEPHTLDEVELGTGEMIYWARENDTWLSIDEDAEEVIMFHDIDEIVEVDGDVLIYLGDDYELSIEVSGALVDQGQKLDTVIYKDYENSLGEVFRTIQMGMASDIAQATGVKIAEMQIQSI